jgi:flavodoxin
MKFFKLKNKKYIYLKKMETTHKKIIIFYYSYHNMNTKKLLEASCANCSNVELIQLPTERTDVSGYDFIGFASGIYYLGMAKEIYEQIEKLKGLEGKHCFSIATSGMGFEKFGYYPKNYIIKKGGLFEGALSIKAYDAFGPFKLIGGINKNKPNEDDFNNTKRFIDNIVMKYENE